MLFAIPSASFGCINAMLHQTFLFLGQLWQLFEVSQILEFLRYSLWLYIIIIFQGDLESYPWYHGQITRQQADSRLKQIAMVGHCFHYFVISYGVGGGGEGGK